jgi:hypothetical protein
MTERGAGLPRISLSPTMLTANYGQTLSVKGDVSAAGWFGPQKPLNPIAPPQVAGRGWDYPSGFNINTEPRAYQPIGFAQLRQFADAYDLLRLVIETRKDQMERMDWSIRGKNKAKLPTSTIDRLTKFISRPCPDHDFTSWLRILLEDLFVIDALTIWKQRNKDGTLAALHPLDGATIKRVIDDWGRTPRGTDAEGNILPAYQQKLKGYPAVNYSADDLIYKPRNLRSNTVYGYSPVEQVIVTVNIALRRQIFQLSYYTEGNIPEALIGVPDQWTPDQIKSFQDYWDSYFTGDMGKRRRAKFVPGGVAKTFIATKEPELKNLYDEWLARIISYAFSVSPQALVNQVNRATANTQKELSEEEGLTPILKYTERLINEVIENDLGVPDAEFKWGADEQIDPVSESTVLVSYVNNGVMTRNEAREVIGMDKVTDAPEADMLMITGSVTPLDGSSEPPEQIDPLTGKPLPGPGAAVPSGKKPDQENVPKTDEKKTPADKEAKKDTAEKLEGGEDLVKYEDDQPRDEKGRFASTGASASRAAERKAAKERVDSHGRLHDRSGRFRSGVTKEKAIDTFHKIGEKVAIAAILGAAGAGLGSLAGVGGIAGIAAAGTSSTATAMAGALLVSGAEQGLGLAFKAMGADAKFATKAAAIVRRNVKDTMKMFKSVHDLTDDSEDMSEAVDIAKQFLPILADKIVRTYLAHISNEIDDDDVMSDFEAGVDIAKKDFLEAVSNLSSTAMKLAKSVKKFEPLDAERPAAKRAINRLTKKLAAIFKKNEAAVREHVKAMMATKFMKSAFGLNDKEAVRIILESELGTMTAETATEALVKMGVDVSNMTADQINERALDWAKSHTDELIGMLDESTQKMVSTAISSGIEENLSEDEIVKKVMDAGFDEDRAALIAMTEIGNANSQGALEGYKSAGDAGVKVMKKWVTVGDDGVDKDVCELNEAQGPIPLDEPFQSGHMAPLGHPRCRCVLVPVVGDEEGDASDGETSDE